VPQNKDLKRLVRARMAAAGENYTQALAHVRAGEWLDPLPSAWHLTGSRADDYELGLLPGVVQDGHRVVRLRLHPDAGRPAGFGALMQSIAATRYLDRRVRFSALLRTRDVTGWAGLWLRVDGARKPLIIDNMRNRPLRDSNGWAEASIVLDVAQDAQSLHFGMLLRGGGAVDLARPSFGVADATTPVTVTADVDGLPDEPQAFDFG
jgi:hypothetical protein